MAMIYYVGDWAIMLWPVFAETPFNYAHKGTEIFNYGKWLKSALESTSDHEDASIPTWDFYRLPPGEFDKGRVMAYTSDPAPHWGCNFVYWDQYDAFWSGCLDWLLRGNQ